MTIKKEETTCIRMIEIFLECDIIKPIVLLSQVDTNQKSARNGEQNLKSDVNSDETWLEPA